MKKTTAQKMGFQSVMGKTPRTAIFKMDGYYVWDGTMQQADDGKYYLIFSLWPKAKGFEAWVTDSKIAYAVSDSPLGPFEYKGIILEGSGGSNWDADVVHNPKMIREGGKYYLYYMGNKGNGEWWNHRNNQRVGVAVADQPHGPWRRFGQPLVDVTPDSFDSLMTSNPTIAKRPDGKFIIVYKGVQDNGSTLGGAVVAGAAVADNPLGALQAGGTLEKQPEPIMVNPLEGWSVEDPYIWYQDDRFYALVKDFQGYFTQHGAGTIAMFESMDGIHWDEAKNPFAYGRQIEWEDGVVENVENLERPDIWLDQNGVPAVLTNSAKQGDDTYIAFTPLKGYRDQKRR